MSSTIILKAAATLAGGVGAHIRLLVDGTQVGSATINSTAVSAYSFGANLAPGQAHNIKIIYDNDAVVNGQDRNLLLQSISFNGQTVAATDSHETYHATSGPGDLPSSGNMYWNGTAEFSLPASYFPTQTAPAGFYIATTGNDGNDGSSAHPFATLNRARVAMEGSSTHTAYVQDGTYALGSTLALGPADSGFTFTAAPGAKPVLAASGGLATLVSANGANNLALSGLSFTGSSGPAVVLQGSTGGQVTANHFYSNQEALLLQGASYATVSGNQIDNSATSGIEVKDGSNHDTFDSNTITGVGAAETNGGAFYLHGTDSNTVSHNQISATQGAGIDVVAMGGYNGSPVLVRNTNTVVSGNVISGAAMSSGDTGGIYVIDRSGQDTGIAISGNEVNGVHSPVSNPHLVGIYLDDYTSGVSVSGNIVRGVSQHAVQFHGGRNDSITGNILDISGYGAAGSNSGVLFQAPPGDVTPNGGAPAATNNTVSGNIFLSDQASATAYEFLSYAGSQSISNNLYYDASGTFRTAPDTSPKTGNPAFAAAQSNNYALGSSPAAASIGFSAINQGSMGVHPAGAHWYA